LAQSLVDKHTTATDTPKTIPEPQLCRLLGFCGLSWDEQDLLPDIWTELRQQTDQPSREVVLRTFFTSLSRRAPAFRHFRNNRLFDDITKYRFEPGRSIDTYHHGLSPLALTLRTFADIQTEEDDADYFAQASNKTVEAVRKHHSKGPPPLPTTFNEFLQLLGRLIILTEGLFTRHCSFLRQMRELHTGLLSREQLILGDPAYAPEFIAQLTWLLITTSRDFYSIICTRHDLEPANDDESAQTAVGNLNQLTGSILAGVKLQLAGVPQQWLHPMTSPTPKPAAKTANTTEGRSGTTTTRTRDNRGTATARQDGSPNAGAGHNPNTPKVFANSALLRDLEAREPNYRLLDIVKAANFKTIAEIEMPGLPRNVCLNWICRGRCQYPSCKREHAGAVDENGAKALYTKLEPGIKLVIDNAKRPRLN
jgi:hypothetical protein